jgi:hypothetical protein
VSQPFSEKLHADDSTASACALENSEHVPRPGSDLQCQEIRRESRGNLCQDAADQPVARSEPEMAILGCSEIVEELVRKA